MTSFNWYPTGMSLQKIRQKIRRIPAFLMALALAVGLVLHGFDGVGMMAKSAMTASDGSMSHARMATSGDRQGSGTLPGKCNGCAGDEKGMVAACSAFCGVMAMPSPSLIVYSVLVERLSPTTAPDLVGRSDPPDPYPPRPTVLS
ncbi:hypothetical protein Bra1253DRAFT_07767 [Bradyrhizobium sp. WSM1253]|nr:hypothetical protein Bra1253DRAFT_07767 [Bradyrhizobium sp. WSM1253]